MHALIFDVDGTLLRSEADNDIYLGAIEAVLGPVRLREGWSAYPHVSNTGILFDILGDNGISVRAAVIDAVKHEFLTRLRAHLDRYGAFQEFPGARAYMQALTVRDDVRCAYATGCWRASALLKLQRADFPTAIPLISSDDAAERAVIMKIALEKLGVGFESVTYFGDGTWDRDAASSLGWRFIAVGPGLGGILSYEGQ